jgi:glutathione S-transferase
MKDQGTLDMYLLHMHSAKVSITMPCYTSKDAAASHDHIKNHFTTYEKALADKSYFLGDYVSAADILFTETWEQAEFLNKGSLKDTYPKLAALHDRVVASNPALKAYIESDDHTKGKFNNKSANVNN